MVVVFFALWLLGAALLLSCSALVWSERMSVLRTIPVCAGCGYELAGLPRAARCPECGGAARKFSVGQISREASTQSSLLWAVPMVAGLVISGMVAVAAKIPSPDNALGTLACAVPFALAGGLVRVMLRWVTPFAAHTLAWSSIVALSLALAGVMLEAALGHGTAPTPRDTFRIAPIMIAPFTGYGLAAGIAIVAWTRTRPARSLPGS